MITTRVTPLGACPACQATLEATTNPRGEVPAPQPGMLTVCLHCATPLTFDADLALMLLDTDTLEPDALMALSEAIRIVRGFQAHQAAKRSKS
jgi:hypothetical protein